MFDPINQSLGWRQVSALPDQFEVTISMARTAFWLDRLAWPSTFPIRQWLPQARVDRTEDKATKCVVLALK